MKKNKWIRIVLTVAGVLLVVLLGLFCAYRLWEKAPEVQPAAPTPAEPRLVDTSAEPQASPEQRKHNVYTVLLVGNDQGNGNTDTIMLARFDVDEHKIDVVSIPRDTMVNINWEIRKINAVFWGSKNSGGNGIDFLKSEIAKLTGFQPDCYAVLDLNVFIQVINAMGGVRFNVPVYMDYEDPTQNLYIHLEPGEQILDGYQAMGVCRFRSGYASGDLGRIEMQHQFLKALAEQFISLGNIPNIGEVIDILANGLETDLDASNIAYFLRQALSCKSEDIRFYTAPSDSSMIHGYSYAIIELDPWLEMVNTILNPYADPISAQDVEIIYRADGGVACTKELVNPDYFSYIPPAPESETVVDDGNGEPQTSTQPVGESGTSWEPEPAPDNEAVVIIVDDP